MHVTTIEVDLAKNVFQIHGVDQCGKPVLKKRLSRRGFAQFMAKLPPCLVRMEVCGGANHWSRTLEGWGHTVKLMSPQFVKPYVKTNKNDCNDAEAICEAVQQPTMRFVAPKTLAQQDLQNLHWVRQHWMAARTALVNQTRGLRAEYGLVLPRQVAAIRQHLPQLLDDPASPLTPLSRTTFRGLYEELVGLDERIRMIDRQVQTLGMSHEPCRRLRQIEGVGPVMATAMIAAVTDPTTFKHGRQLAAWLGLVPRQCSSGHTQRLLGISKRGDRYLRTLLIDGARSVVTHVGTKTDARSQWIQAKRQQRGMNRTCVAVANKNARIIWALLTKGESYRRVA
ncbi:MAG: IS110 family transposase [Nitrospirales bacterium]|nr:IS110 family transposase [Nitrospirales bacterium]